MKKIIILFLIILFTGSITVLAQDNIVLKASISMINAVPKQFFGTWSVQSTQISTNSPKTFAKTSLDIWNLRRSGNVIELRNPVTSAVAEIYLEDVKDSEIVFTHYEREGYTNVKDTVRLKLDGDTFIGTNELTLHTVRYDEFKKKYEDIKTAVYELKGSKVMGTGLY
ncbi:hypothetical protein IKE67_06920 [bacterium]|nr:hypothetical protein [bacterium]